MKTRNKPKLPSIASDLPPPTNGTEYTPKETIALLQDYPEILKQKIPSHQPFGSTKNHPDTMQKTN